GAVRWAWGGSPGRFTAGPPLRLPAVVPLGPDAPVVNVLDAPQLLAGQRRQRRGAGVLPRLFDVPRAGDHRGDAGLLDDPAQRDLGRGSPGRHQGGELARGVHAGVEVHPGEGLPHVERLAVAGVTAMVARGQRGVVRVTGGTQPPGEPDTPADP